MRQEAANQKQVDIMAPFSDSYEQTGHYVLDWPCDKYTDSSISFTGESSGPNAVLKAFPDPKEKKSGMKRHHLKILRSGTKGRP